MENKKYLDYTGLTTYNNLIKDEISNEISARTIADSILQAQIDEITINNFTCGEIIPETENFVSGTTYSIQNAFQKTANLFGGLQPLETSGVARETTLISVKELIGEPISGQTETLFSNLGDLGDILDAINDDSIDEILSYFTNKYANELYEIINGVTNTINN